MAVNLIDNEEIHVNQDGSDITLDIQADALKNDSVVVGSIRSKNMLNQNIYDLGYYDNSGTFANSSANVAFSYIPVESNKNYVFSAVSNCQNIAIVEFDSSKTFIKRNVLYSNKAISITTTSTTKYIRCQLNYNGSTISKNTIITLQPQFEEGSTATTYSPYQNLDGYDNYSTAETRIGTWKDGKPLYRKVITRTVNANTNDNVSLSTLGITNQDTIIINIGLSTAHYQISTTGGGYAPIIYYVSNTDRSHVYVNANKELQIQNQNNNQREYNIVLEYTKTTD